MVPWLSSFLLILLAETIYGLYWIEILYKNLILIYIFNIFI